jgi:hypothetical protein
MKNKIVTIGTLSLLSLLSFGKNITNANAANIADPDGWSYKYDYDTVSGRFEFTHVSLGSNGFRVPFLQPVSNTFEADYLNGFDVGDIVDDEEAVSEVGFWIRSQRTDFGTFTQDGSVWYPNTDLIGSNFSTPPVPQKLWFIFSNQSATNYQLGLNVSDSGTTANWNYRYLPSDNVNVGALPMEDDPAYLISANFTRSTTNILYWYLPPFTNLYINSPTGSTASAYFRSFWLGEGSTPFVATYEDGYQAGLESGYDNGFIDGQDSAESNITSRISNLLSQVFAGVRNVFNIKIFDQLTIGSVMLFPLAFGIFTFIFRLIRGGKA